VSLRLRLQVSLLALAGALAPACGSPSVTTSARGPSAAETWRRAEALWQSRDVNAYDAWLAIDARSPEGREARRRLAQADRHYREAIRRLEADEAGARDAMRAGLVLAPMDPALYLPLARAYRDWDLDPVDTEYYYRMFLTLRPDHPEARAAAAELFEFAPRLRATFHPPPARPASSVPAREHAAGTAALSGESAAMTRTVALVAFGVALGLALASAIALGVWLWRRGVSLETLAAARPELHPAIAYLVGCVRHELLKHRIGAVGDAVHALVSGRPSVAQLSFLQTRLYGGEPLRRAWEGHVSAFERALGPEVDLRRRDRHFRRARRAIDHIARLEARIARGETTVSERLARAHATLQEFDRYLAGLVAGLIRTTIDGALLREVVSDVQAEYSAGLVQLDDLAVVEPEEPVMIEVFRVDFVVVLKNLVRNAILAAGRSPAPRKIAVDVRVDVEATGEEIVRIRVRDTSAEALTTEAIYERRVDRGLGLVTAALSRYDAAIEVEPASQGYAKAVTVRFFRALAEPTSSALEGRAVAL